MAHNLFNNRSMLWVGQRPWHGLGVELPSNFTIEDMRAAGLLYTVEGRELFFPGSTEPVPDRKAIVRSDTNTYFATVGADYGIVQNEEGAAAVLEAVQGVDGAVFHTAGLLGERGERWWMLGELGAPIRVEGYQSEIIPYVLATSAHDGRHAFNLLRTPTNVVCQNTLNAALKGSGAASFSVRHTSRAASRVAQVAQALRDMIHGYTRFGEMANVLAKTPFSDAQFETTIETVLPIPEDGKDHPRTKKHRDTVRGLRDTAVGAEGVTGNAWSAFQAWTEFAHHYLSAAKDQSKRLDSTWNGRGAAMTQEALEVIAKVADVRMVA